MDKHLLIALPFLFFIWNDTAAQQSANDQVYQYTVTTGNRRAYLWLPPDSKLVKGVIISLSNLLERNWLEDPIIRKAAAAENLGIIWVGPNTRGSTNTLSADVKPGEERVLQQMMKDFADASGYAELEWAPFIPMGHSANGQFAWRVPNWNAERTIASIPIKTVPLPAAMKFEGVPLCYVVGQTTEWPQYRVPDPAVKPGDRDFFWPMVRQSAVKLRHENDNNLVSVVTDPGGGHFDWSPRIAAFIALFIHKACYYRLPKDYPVSGPVTLKKIDKTKGWLTDTGGMQPDSFPSAPYQKYKGDKAIAYWFFDEETAKAAVVFNGDRIPRKKQMLTFVQDGVQLAVAKQGFAALKFQPLADGISWKVEADFLTSLPPELIGAGEPLGHAEGPILFKVIDGPAIQTSANTFAVQFNRGNVGGAIWLLAEHSGNNEYRHAVQPAQLTIPAKLLQGKPQAIEFPPVKNITTRTHTVRLDAQSDSGLPTSYYVVAGPAVIEGNELKITKIPLRSKYPVKVTVVAYQWGRTTEPLWQSAEPVTSEFLIEK